MQINFFSCQPQQSKLQENWYDYEEECWFALEFYNVEQKIIIFVQPTCNQYRTWLLHIIGTDVRVFLNLKNSLVFFSNEWNQKVIDTWKAN